MNKNTNSQKLGRLPSKEETERLKKAVKKGDKKALMDSLSENDKEVLRSFMRDKEARDRLLSSPEVQALISNLFGKE
jgi:hypothetical protein